MRASISVFLKADTDAAAVEAIARNCAATRTSQSVVVKTPDQGLEEFRAHSGFADALKVLHYNPLPALLIVSPRAAAAASTDPAPALVEEFRRDPAVDQVQYDAAWKQRLNAILQLARRGAAVLAVLLALAALLVVGNTVRLDIQGRADEIAVMQLLGADNGFVRRPFLYIGFWYGMFAGVASLVLIGLVEWALAAPLSALASSYDHRFDVHGLSLAQMAIVLAASAALGWLGAWIAASRHIALGQPTVTMEAALTRHITTETPRVMVVDGSKVVRRLIEQLLKADLPGVTVLSCETGAEAKQHLESGVVDLVTTALRLPDMDGLDLAKLRARKRAAGLHPDRDRFRRCQRAPDQPRAFRIRHRLFRQVARLQRAVAVHPRLCAAGIAGRRRSSVCGRQPRRRAGDAAHAGEIRPDRASRDQRRRRGRAAGNGDGARPHSRAPMSCCPTST